MGARERSTRRTAWRSAIAFVAAYLLVLQAALAGAAMPPTQPHDRQAMPAICLNGGIGAASDGKTWPAPFDCCSLGCLVGSQTLQTPSPPDHALTYPAARSYDPGRKAQASPHGSAASDQPRATGPPAGV